MQNIFKTPIFSSKKNISHHLFIFALVGFLGSEAQSQGSGRLYDLEPPADSSYLRIFVAQPAGNGVIEIDGKIRIHKLPFQKVSDYLILNEGNHHIVLTSQGKVSERVEYKINTSKGNFYTLAFPNLKPGMVPLRFEDRRHTNQLKSQITAYHLHPHAGNLDVNLAGGNAKVFSNLAYGTGESRQVNPINVDLNASGAKFSSEKFSINLHQGDSYSLFFIEDKALSLRTVVAQNKIERYIGK